MSPHRAKEIARRYLDAWSSGRFDDAVSLLDEAIRVEVPVNEYPTRESFAAALTAFGSMVERVDVIAELGGEGEAMQLYDLSVRGLGALRIVEHFTLREGRIVRLRQIHDTAGLRAAGFAS